MNLFLIAWRSIQQRGLASALTTLSMALGVMMVIAVLAIYSVVSESFKNNSKLPVKFLLILFRFWSISVLSMNELRKQILD